MTDAGGIRVEFEDFVVDPRNPDHAYRALEVPADLVTFEDGQAVFWCEGVEEARFPASAIRSLAPRLPTTATKATKATTTTASTTAAGAGTPDADDAGAQVAYVAEVRRKHPKAYTAWSEDDEARLAELFRAGRSVEELMTEFGRQRGGIMSRLEKLGLRAGDAAAAEGSLPPQSRGTDPAAAGTAETAGRRSCPRTPTAADAERWPEPPF